MDVNSILKRLLAFKDSQEPYCAITDEEIKHVTSTATQVFLTQPVLLRVDAPVNICGDTHGQFKSAVRLMTECGALPKQSYLFLGDYVDRGKNSIEVLMLMLVYKVLYPDRLHILRGNHECARVNGEYGFRAECVNRYNMEVYIHFNDCLAHMPIAAIVSSRIFCCHGGIPKTIKDLADIDNLKRPDKDPPADGMMMELMWSDPNRDTDEWRPSPRGAGWNFGPTALQQFLEKFDLDLLARAHEVIQDGYEFFADRRCVTIFSASNYCGMDNAGAIMLVADDLTCRFTVIRPKTDENPITQIEQHGMPGDLASAGVAFQTPEVVAPKKKSIWQNFFKFLKPKDNSGTKEAKKKQKCSIM